MVKIVKNRKCPVHKTELKALYRDAYPYVINCLTPVFYGYWCPECKLFYYLHCEMRSK